MFARKRTHDRWGHGDVACAGTSGAGKSPPWGRAFAGGTLFAATAPLAPTPAMAIAFTVNRSPTAPI